MEIDIMRALVDQHQMDKCDQYQRGFGKRCFGSMKQHPQIPRDTCRALRAKIDHQRHNLLHYTGSLLNMMSLMRRDGTSVQTNNINLISTDVTQHDVKPDRNLLKNLDDLITPIHTIKANNENWRSYIQYQIHQLDDYTPDAVTKDNMFIHKLAVVNGEVVEDVAQVPDHVDEKQQQEELEQTLRYIEEMRSKYYTSALDDLKPAEFPAELWKYVTDSQKVLIPNRWKLFKEKCSPPERLQEVIQLIMKIDISVENPSRKAEEPYFRAQCLSNLHVYAHPDPKDPPSVKGREYEINLHDVSPCTAGMRKTSLLEKSYLY